MVKKILMLAVFMGALAILIACQKASADVEYRAYKDDADVPRIKVEDAKKEFDAGTAIIVDARPAESYKQEHIAGSINMTSSSDEYIAKLPKGKKIILYCS